MQLMNALAVMIFTALIYTQIYGQEIKGDAIVFPTGDGILLSAGDDIFFRVGGSTKALMNQDGDLGLGTTSPAAKLLLHWRGA